VIASCLVSYRTSYDTRTEAVRDFRELRLSEVRRITFPRTRVNESGKVRDYVAKDTMPRRASP
jgi:hypothetical protein